MLFRFVAIHKQFPQIICMIPSVTDYILSKHNELIIIDLNTLKEYDGRKNTWCDIDVDGTPYYACTVNPNIS